MQHMGYTNGPSAPSASELEVFDKLFDGNLIASEAEALDELFPTVGKAPSRQQRRRKATSSVISCVDIGCLLLCNIEIRGLLLGWSSFGCVRSTSSALHTSALYVCLNYSS